MKPTSSLSLIAVLALTFASACNRSSVESADNEYAKALAKEKTASYSPAPSPTPFHAPTPAPDPVAEHEASIRQNMLAASESKITYEQLAKNADRYQGQPWAFRGAIVQIQEPGGQTSALVALDAFHEHIMKVKADFTTDFVEKDQVYIVGTLIGNYSYTSEAGWNITIPAIDAQAILKPSDAARIKAGKKASKQ